MMKKRVPLQVSPMFRDKIKQIQDHIKAEIGKSVSLRDITESMATSEEMLKMENKLLQKGNIEIKVRFDRRML